MFQVPARGWWRGQVDERDEAAGQVQQPGGQVRQPGVVLHVAAPGAEGRLQEGGMEGGGLRDQDGGRPQRPARPPQQHAEQTHGQPGRDTVRGQNHGPGRAWTQQPF